MNQEELDQLACQVGNNKAREIYDTGKAFDVLKKAMQKDADYAYAWHANLAMAYYDVMPDNFWMPDRTEQHRLANDAASNFMSRCFNVKTSLNMMHIQNKDSTIDTPKKVKNNEKDT